MYHEDKFDDEEYDEEYHCGGAGPITSFFGGFQLVECRSCYPGLSRRT
jgi:hypothetical protein